MNLDEFRNLFKKEGFANRQIKVGAVLKYMATETNPPKIKRRIVVAFSNDKMIVASLFINSEINPNLFSTEELKKLHLPFEKENHEYLDHDSFVDCSQFIEILYQDLADIITENPMAVIGELSNSD